MQAQAIKLEDLLESRPFGPSLEAVYDLDLRVLVASALALGLGYKEKRPFGPKQILIGPKGFFSFIA